MNDCQAITLTGSTASVQYLCGADPRLADLIKEVGELAYTPEGDPFVSLADTVVGQMLSNKVAEVLAARLHTLCGSHVSPAVMAGLGFDALRSIGLSKTKTACLLDLAGRAIRKELDFDAFREMPDDAIIQELTSIKGIGPWTAKMYLIFVLDRQDVLPFEDGAFLQSYRWAYNAPGCTAKEIVANCAKWRPYSSIAARYLYRALDEGVVNKTFLGLARNVW